MMLAYMRDQIWTAIHALTESEGVTFEDCLNLTLCILLLLPQIPMDISYKTQIPLTITYCPESSIYRRWHSKQGRVSPLCKEVRASQTLSKVLGRVTAKKAREWTMLHLPPSPKALWDQVDHEAPGLDHVAMLKVSPHTIAGNQALPSLRPLMAARKPAANLNPPTQRRMLPMKMSMQRPMRVKLRS